MTIAETHSGEDDWKTREPKNLKQEAHIAKSTPRCKQRQRCHVRQEGATRREQHEKAYQDHPR